MDEINECRERRREKIKSIIDGIFMELLLGVDPNDQGGFIFRGHKGYGLRPVKSSLRRVLESSSYPITNSDLVDLDITHIESLLHHHASMYSGEDSGDRMEILSYIQHYGGATNRIDFTESFKVALFFACEDYSNHKDGQRNDGEIFLLPRDGEGYQITKRSNKIKRALKQKSIFVESPKGSVKCSRSVKIPYRYKPGIFRYLWDYCDISPFAMYGDMQGYIDQAAAGKHDGFIEFQSATAYAEGARKFKELKDDAKMDAAILKSLQCYDAVIKKDPHNADAYHNRGSIKILRRDFRGAWKDFDKGGKIGSRSSVNMAYFNRGILFAYINKHARSIRAFELAFKLSKNHSDSVKGVICTEIIKCCGMFGNNCQIKGDWEHAISYYQQIKHLCQYVRVKLKSIQEVDERIAECESKLRTQG